MKKLEKTIENSRVEYENLTQHSSILKEKYEHLASQFENLQQENFQFRVGFTCTNIELRIKKFFLFLFNLLFV